jgi:hypothetical protein
MTSSLSETIFVQACFATTGGSHEPITAHALILSLPYGCDDVCLYVGKSGVHITPRPASGICAALYAQPMAESAEVDVAK